MMKNYKEELIKEIQQIEDEVLLKFLYKFLIEFKRENNNLEKEKSMEIKEAIEGFKIDNELLAGTGNESVIERNNLAITALEKDEHKCDECAGCTSWKCDCSNIRNKAIDDFTEALLTQKVIDNSVIKRLAEQLKID